MPWTCPVYHERKFSPKRMKTSVRLSKSWKNKHFGTDMPRGRPRKNFGLKNFGLIFRYVVCPVEMSRPVCPADILSNLCGITLKSGRDVPGFAPKPSPRHFQTTPTTKFLYVFFVYRLFLLPTLPRMATLQDIPSFSMSLKLVRSAMPTCRTSSLFRARIALQARSSRRVCLLYSGMARVRLADLNGPKWTSSGQNGPIWSILVHFGLANAKIQFGIRSF